MATLEELQQQIIELQEKVAAITVPPTDYYTHRWSGEEIDDAVDRSRVGGDIDAALSNKAARIDHGTDTVDALGPLGDGMHRAINWESLPAEAPDKQGYILAEDYVANDGVVTWGRRIFTSPHDDFIWINSCVVGTWIGWKKISTAIPPQEYDLSLVEGWDHEHSWDKNCYCKTQENVVIVHFSARNSNAVNPGDYGYVLGYLPEGFRPSAAVTSVCGDYNYSGTSIYHCWIHPDGSIIICSPEKAPVGASGTMVFVASN